MIEKKQANTKKYILIELLESFSIQELERLEHFVASAYFNTDKWVIKLLKALRKKIIGKQTFSTEVQIVIYQAVFSDLSSELTSLNQQQKKLLGAKMSVLTQLAKRFLVHDSIEKHPVCEAEILHKQLLDRNQHRLITKLYKKNQKYLELETARGVEYYKLAWAVEANHLEYLHKADDLTKRDNFPALINNLDMYYLLNKLELHGTMLSIENVSKKNYDFTSMECVTSLLEVIPYKEHPLIIIYKTIYQLMTTWKETSYRNLLKLLDQYSSKIPKKYLIAYYQVANIYCARQIRKGKTEYNQEIFDIIKKRNKQNLLIEGEFVQPLSLKNWIIVACRVQEFEWAVAIIEKYQSFIKKSLQESVYNYNHGIISFYKKNYKNAISHFIRVEKFNLAYDLDCRLLLLKSHYELDSEYDERTMQIFRSTEQFIKNQKSLPTAHKRSNKNFVQILISLYRIKHSVGKKTLEAVRKTLSTMDTVMAKQWLLEKIKEIGKV